MDLGLGTFNQAYNENGIVFAHNFYQSSQSFQSNVVRFRQIAGSIGCDTNLKGHSITGNLTTNNLHREDQYMSKVRWLLTRIVLTVLSCCSFSTLRFDNRSKVHSSYKKRTNSKAKLFWCQQRTSKIKHWPGTGSIVSPWLTICCFYRSKRKSTFHCGRKRRGDSA